MTIIELLIDDFEDDNQGIEGIALVEKPAHESNFMTFAEEETIDDYIFINELTGTTGVEIAEEIVKLGETHQDLVEQGYMISKVEVVKPNKMNFAYDWNVPQAPELEIGGINKTKGNITIYSNPNATSGKDSLGADKIRYRYSGPRDGKNRDFCRILLQEGRVYREEDMNYMVNADFPQYSILQFRGSYNCRHFWIKLTYTPDKRILNDDRARYGRTGQEDITQQPTETLVTANAKERNFILEQIARRVEQEIVSDIRAEIVRAGLEDKPLDLLTLTELRVLAQHLGFSYRFSEFGILDVVDGIPVFENIEDALKLAEMMGCEGAHAHLVDGHYQEGYMPCAKHEEVLSECGCGKQEFETYDDYPQEARDNACKVLRWIEEHGRDEVDGMTQTGLARANQLCSGENISEETISRMAAFERHRQNAEISEEFKGTPWKDKGYVAWLGWGGDAGISWAQRKLEQIANEKMELVVNAEPYVNQTGGTLTEESVFDLGEACWPGYQAVGLKDKNGKKVPNCVKIENSYQFSTDDEKMEITGAAIIPKKLIIRRDELGRLYYVYFSEETTKLLAEKFFKDKLIDSTNIEHTSKKARNTFVTESWIVENPEMDKSKALGLDYPKGTWVITMKVNNKELWTDIKNGKYNGYSIEGMFLEKLIK